MSNIIKITKSQIQANSARILDEKQINSATTLKALQENEAMRIRETDVVGPPTEDVYASREALRKSQDDAAHFLRLSQKEAAEALATANTKSNQAEKDHQQAMSLVLGGYSVQPESDPL